MPRSQFASARRLRALVYYLGAAFLVVLVADAVLPAGTARSLLTIGWVILFPLGGWWVFRSTRDE